MAIANLAVSLTARTGQFDRAMRRAGKTIRRFSGTLRNLSGIASLVAGGSVGVLAGRSFQLIDAQAKVADRLGASQKAMAGLELAARRSGVTTQTLSMAMQRMTRRVAEAAMGTGEAREALKTLNLDAQALVRLSADEQMREIAEALDGVGNAGQRVALAMKLFDSEGVALVNTLRGGKGALDEAQQAAEQFGLSVSDVDAKKIEEANDAFGDIADVFRGFFNQIAVRLAPLITEAAQSFVDWATEGDTAGTKVQRVLDDIVLPAIARVIDGWNFISGSIQVAIGLTKKWVADIFDGARAIPILGDTIDKIAGAFDVDLSAKSAALRKASDEALEAGSKKLEEVLFGGGSLRRLQQQLAGVFRAAEERARDKVNKTAPTPEATIENAVEKAAVKIGEFREVDLRRMALGGSRVGIRKQEVTAPELTQMVDLLRRIAASGGAVAV